MRTRALVAAAAAALLGAVAPVASQGQDRYSADFPGARRLFVDGQAQKAAYTLNVASAYVRQELGRCRDATVGERLMEAEGRIDRLVARLRVNGVGSVATLDSAFAQTDRLLAEHYWRLAAWELANPKLVARAMIGQDIGAAASHFARSFRFSGQEMEPAAAGAVAEARRIADVIASTDAIPKEASQVLDVLGRHIAPPAVIAIR